MANSEPLFTFGIAVIVIVGLFIAVPFFRRRSDLLTAWNTLLLGVICFAGLGSIEVIYNPTLPWEQLSWFQPSDGEVQWYMWATSAFIAALIAAYYLNGPAKTFAQNRFRKWPEVDATVTFFLLGCCAVTLAVSVLVRSITFIGPIFFNLAQIAAPAATVFSFRLWYRNRTNFGWLVLFLGVFACAALYTMVVSAGRRLLLSVFLGPVLIMYWNDVRHWGRFKTIVTLALAGTFMLGVSAVYSKFRYYSAGGEQRSARAIVGQLQDLRAKGDWFGMLRRPLEYFGQSNAQFALLTQRYVAQGVLVPVPLNTLRFLATYPIPRKIWSRKPDVIGVKITRDIVREKGTNWGLGVAGQGAYEGGIYAVVIYAILLAFFMRLIDEPLRQQPDNPFLIYMLASAIPHIVAIPRGDMGVMTMQAGQCVLFAFVLGLACRAIFGTRRTSARAPAQPNGPGYRDYRIANPRIQR